MKSRRARTAHGHNDLSVYGRATDICRTLSQMNYQRQALRSNAVRLPELRRAVQAGARRND